MFRVFLIAHHKNSFRLMQHNVVCRRLLKAVCGSSLLFIRLIKVSQSVRLTSALTSHYFEKPSMFCTAPFSLILHRGICSRHTR